MTACSNSAGDDPDSGSRTLRFSTILAPDDYATEAVRRFAAEVEENTAGAVTVEVFDSGSLFDQNQAQQAIQRGDLDMTFIGPQEISDRVPAASIVTVPYMIENPEHLYAVMSSEVGERIFSDTVETLNIRPLTTVYVGTRQLNLRDIGHRVMTPEDLNGVKLRIPDQDSWIYMARSLGADPTPVAFGELYLALQTGAVDAQETALPLTFSSKFYEVTSSVSLTGHVVTDYWPTINEDTWQGLSEDEQRAIHDAWLVARDEATGKTVQREAELQDYFRDEGLDVYEPDVDAFREHVQGIYLNDEAVVGQWPEGLLETLQAVTY
ncbi:DctP family TRAP transporter solute-binding subunit [Phytoactinopolyspora alkaliphila]|uniref:DctP family TRAP transporter solute-binding subunit n=1 Tax=Phytoactinopolyspora alkaliphila TaxID=1783498 RepID=A0A6N9YNE5_9ACTN|nr:DctP family TRAP transporter solute-binding subunit [Phytoactinopolyspora alkaliphila]NED96523.1 DctP family TRAP transporter solute-binding subunit [Phytoactinopolyspora alkaliphila]